MTDVDLAAPPPTPAPASGRPRGVFAWVFVPLVALYAATAAWSLPYHGDALTNAVAGWYWAHTGSPYLTEHSHLATPDYYGNLAWFVEAPGGVVAQYPPGAAWTTVPLYWVVPGLEPVQMVGNNRPDLPPVDFPLPALWPATAAAVLLTAAAMGLLAAVFAGLGSRRQAIAGGLVAGIATSAWAVASDMSWTHGPAMFWIALGLYLASKERWLLTGLAMSGAILARPHTAAIAAGLGVLVALAHRRWRPLVAVGAGSAPGMIGLLAYNLAVWRRLTISGGYGGGFADRLADPDLLWFARNVAGALFDLRHGLLIWGLFLVVLVFGLPFVTRRAPAWSVGAAVGGLIYLLIQLKANRFTGGEGHFGYRYPLEALTAAAPLLFASYVGWVAKLRVRRLAFWLGVGAAVFGQIAGAVFGVFVL